MNFLLPIYIWPIFRLLSDAYDEDETELEVAVQSAKNRPNVDWQDKIHRGILRGLRNISENP
jgi:hypothetical protein